MYIRVPKEWLQEYTEGLLREVDVPQSVIDTNLAEFIHEAAEHTGIELEEGEYLYYGSDDED